MLVVPPGSGIVLQANVEYFGWVVFKINGTLYPNSVVGTEATMLGQPMSMVLPSAVGFKLTGNLRNSVTATDLVLTVTQMKLQACCISSLATLIFMSSVIDIVVSHFS